MKAKKTVILAEVAILAATILLMAFTPIGYLRMPGVEITFLMVPVVVGAIAIGPLAGAVLGGLFGLTSFFQCFGMSVFGSTLLGINPVFTFIMCLVPRILAGLVPGLLFKLFRKKNILSLAVASLSGTLLNTVLFVVSFALFFSGSDFFRELQAGNNIFWFLCLFVGLNGLIEAAACGILGTAISKAVYTLNSKKIA